MELDGLRLGQDAFPTHIRSHQILRAAAVAASFVSGRHLFTNGFHYPYVILLAHATAVVLIEVACGGCGDRENTQSRPERKRIIWQLLFFVSIALGLIFTYQSSFHNRNTTLGVMILALDWPFVVERLLGWLRLRSDRQRGGLHDFLSVLTFLGCVGIMAWNDDKLIETGILQLIGAALFCTVARILWSTGRVESPISLGSFRIDSFVVGIATCIPLCVIPIMAFRPHVRRDFHIGDRGLWVVLSLFSGTLALLSETTLKRLTSSIQSRISATTAIDHDFGSHLFSLVAVAAVEIDNGLAQNRPETTRAAQWLAFAIASLATIKPEWIPFFGSGRPQTPPSYIQIPIFKVSNDPEDERIEDAEAFLPRHHTHEDATWSQRVSLAWQSLLGSLTILLILTCTVGRPAPAGYKPAPDLDIVIAWYDEPIEHVISTARLAIDLPSLAGRRTRTIVYNKGPSDDGSEAELEKAFPHSDTAELIIRQLENVGREGETYLTHTLRHGNETAGEGGAASHTMFIQAEPHETWYLEARLRDYFVAETGFLSLSYVRNVCPSCDDCNDDSGWTIGGDELSYLFAQANGGDKMCRDVSLTYRGQFVVSQRRMARANKALFDEARARLLNDAGFGFTLERMWGTMFQCPTQSERCPTLMSGWLGNVAEMGDCQCLDDVEDNDSSR